MQSYNILMIYCKIFWHLNKSLAISITKLFLAVLEITMNRMSERGNAGFCYVCRIRIRIRGCGIYNSVCVCSNKGWL